MEELPSQYETFKDCLARHIIAKSASASSVESPEDDGSLLSDFSYLSHEVWPTLPPSFHNASYETRSSLPDLDTDLDPDSMSATLRLENIPTSFSDSLISYSVCDDWDSAVEFLRKVVVDYMQETCKPPPVWSATRKDHKECEMCEREVPLTYHHLIPRSTHARVLKKKWHPESMLNSVAWLCRPCHSAVHHAASNEELARSYYTLDLLLEREDIQRWRRYAAKQRYGVKRG